MIDPPFLDFPLARHPTLDAALGCTFTIKLETANPNGSFNGYATEAVLYALAAAVPGSDPALVAAFLGNYFDLYWALPPDLQDLLLRLPPSAYGDDRGIWGVVRADTYHLRGDPVRTRIYADSARQANEAVLRTTPNDAQRRAFHGVELAYLGGKADAIAEGERAMALAPMAKDGYNGPYMQHQLARIYLILGEPEKALDQLEPLLRVPYYLSPGWLRVDPTFDPLRNNPRFKRLVGPP